MCFSVQLLGHLFPPSNPWICMQFTKTNMVINNTVLLPRCQLTSFNSVSPYFIWCILCTLTTKWNSAPSTYIKRKTLILFFIRFIAGNIRVCQGCRGSLRLSDGLVPAAPNNIVIAHLEKQPYFDKASGMWCYPQKETHSHYHLKLTCVVTAEPLFMPSTSQVPPELLMICFQVTRSCLLQSLDWLCKHVCYCYV